MNDLDFIRQLEKESRLLEPGDNTRNYWQTQTNAYAEALIHKRKTHKAYEDSSDKGLGLLEHPIGEEPLFIDEVLSLVENSIDPPGIDLTSSRHFGYIPGGALYPAALGDFLAAIGNKYAGGYFASPGSVRLENLLVQWIADLMGYPATAAGTLTSGGSTAHLIAITAAREALELKAKDYHRAVIYVSAQTHHSVLKGLTIAGMREAEIRYLPVDDAYRLQTAGLPELIDDDRGKGLIPFMLVATAGTTEAGAIDDLDLLADICQQKNTWFHVDAAYGGFFMLCEEVASKLTGIQRSDSFVVDPHKGLFLPYGSGAVVVRDRRHILAANSYHANYMQDALQDEELDPASLSPELSRHFRGLRMWMPLKLFGLKPFRAALAEKVHLARYFYDHIQHIPGFEVGPFPDISVVLFRYVPEKGDANGFNRSLVKELLADGRVYLSTTTIDGIYYLRLAVGVYRTHLDDIELCLQILEELAARLSVRS
jgi:glutamate/tyrosine decarboxylase-like PLP-dependent enzyme